jgi:hypothetical protein
MLPLGVIVIVIVELVDGLSRHATGWRRRCRLGMHLRHLAGFLTEDDHRPARGRGILCEQARPPPVKAREVRRSQSEAPEQLQGLWIRTPPPHEVEPRLQVLIQWRHASRVAILRLHDQLIQRDFERPIMLEILDEPVRPSVLRVLPDRGIDVGAGERRVEIEPLRERGLDLRVARERDAVHDGVPERWIDARAHGPNLPQTGER